jgi:hypothetical protein
MAFPAPTYRAPEAEGEWEIVQSLLRPVASPVAQEFLLHYYISAKSWPMVLLIGRPGMGPQRLFELLAGGIAGCSDGQIRLLPTQARWAPQPAQGEEGRPALGLIQGRFNTMAFFDMLGEATMPSNEGRTYFLGLEQATPQELAEYMDLYLKNPLGDEAPPPLPSNLYLTAVVPIQGGAWCLPEYLLDRVGIVEVTIPLGQEEAFSGQHCPPVGRQRLFLRSTVREPERARQRLQRHHLLNEFCRLLASLPAGLLPLDAALEEGLLLYTANAFTSEGEGLLDRTPLANLRQAVDLQLAQRLLPCIAQRTPWTPARGREIADRLDTIFPRAHARARRILIERNHAEGAESAE